jgi:hypothetical protein
MLLVSSIILISLSIIPFPDCEADEHKPKAIISLDQSRVDIEINQTKLNFATVTGSVLIELNETEHGFLWLYADAEDFNTVIAPSTFRIDSNSSTLDFTVDTYIPNGYLGGEVRTLKVYGNITLTSDNSSIHPVEPVYAMISINPLWSIDVGMKKSFIEIPPSKTGILQVEITNNAHPGVFIIEVDDLEVLQEKEYIVIVEPTRVNLSTDETTLVNITVDLPDLWTLWTNKVVPINVNVTDEEGEVLGKSHGIIRIKGIFLGGFEGIFCVLGVVIIILFIFLGALDIGTRGTKEERMERKKLKREKKYAKILAKMKRKGIYIEELDDEKNEPEPPPEPMKCPYCDSTDIKTTLSGKSKCRDCERMIDDDEDE